MRTVDSTDGFAPLCFSITNSPGAAFLPPSPSQRTNPDTDNFRAPVDFVQGTPPPCDELFKFMEQNIHASVSWNLNNEREGYNRAPRKGVTAGFLNWA
ncbi:hypothetical protein LshimejAT787_0502780 [Lyophyllum shimeji]|uniref:Uncharacterized protein n=1 Tax=Lyophyllum shimeji TaxID=47721 RepID=A0A9P3PM26_LYOSH|nr:hypothetical protein LshimejAT787_0502780 [Lyophyllum shimeji]